MPDAEGLLSQGSYLEVSFETSIANVTFDDDPATIVRAAGSFIDDGFVAGNVVYTDNGSNPGPFTIVTVAALTLTVTEAVVADAVAGTQLLTTYVKVGEVNSLTTPAGEPSEIDMTHLRSDAREFRNGLRDEGTISGEMNFVPDDQGQIILAEMQGEKLPRAVRITIPAVDEGENTLPGYRWTFSGLARGMPVSLAVDEKATRAFTIRVTGGVTEEVIAVA